MEAYSLDLRSRIVQACDEKLETRQEIADRFGVCTAFIRRLLQRRRECHSIAAKPHRGGFASKLNASRLEEIGSLVLEQPDATLAELCDRLHQRTGIKVSISTMCLALRRLGLVRKKRRCMPANVTLPGFGRCGRAGAGRWRGSSRGSSYLLMKAARRLR
jgi:transposase